MLLALDVGNSEIDVGLSDGTWRAMWHLPTDPRRTADEIRLLIHGLLEARGFAAADVSSAVVASVVPAVTPMVVACCLDGFGVQPLVVGPGMITGLPVRYDPPRSLGADRLANAVAAKAEFGAPVVVADFGSATTFTVVNPVGELVGGAIAAGVGLAADALVAAGARLHVVSLAGGRPSLLGRTTDESIRSGVLFGHAGLVDGLLGRIERELGAVRPTVVATGGFAATVQPLTERIDVVRPALTLDGLVQLWRLNSGAANA